MATTSSAEARERGLTSRESCSAHLLKTFPCPLKTTSNRVQQLPCHLFPFPNAQRAIDAESRSYDVPRVRMVQTLARDARDWVLDVSRAIPDRLTLLRSRFHIRMCNQS